MIDNGNMYVIKKMSSSMVYWKDVMLMDPDIPTLMTNKVDFKKLSGMSGDPLNKKLWKAEKAWNPLTKTGYYKKILNIPVTFDTETTSFIDENGNKKAWVYMWMFGFGETIVYGRTPEEYAQFIDAVSLTLDLNKDFREMNIYVHNLGFDYEFIRNYVAYTENYNALKARRPYCIKLRDGTVYKCSYILTLKSLEKIGNECLTMYKATKKVGDLDYTKIRHYTTPLSAAELEYCRCDIEVLSYYIQEQIIKENGITNIPATSTGYVRRDCRNHTLRTPMKTAKGEKYPTNEAYYKMIHDLTLTPDDYDMAKAVYAGGLTHANSHKAGKMIKGVQSMDETSAYPATMVLDAEYPISKPYDVDVAELTINKLTTLMKNYCCMMYVEFTGLWESFKYEHIISKNKCLELDTPIEDNGRLIGAKRAVVPCTELDFEMITKFYKFKSYKVIKMKIMKKGRLPKEYVETVLRYYTLKNTLKGIKGREDDYQFYKGLLNALYGLLVTDPLRDRIESDDRGNVTTYKLTPDEKKEALKKYNESRSRFTYYLWGVWVSSINRHRICQAILEDGEDHCYTDTDSEKCTNYEKHKAWYDSYNVGIYQKCLQLKADYGFDEDTWNPKNEQSGKRYMIGTFDDDGYYRTFKTLGAKRYLTFGDEYNKKLRKTEHVYHLTVSGMKKKPCLEYIKEVSNNNHDEIFKTFNNGLEIPAEKAHSPEHTYRDEEFTMDVTDYLGNVCEVHQNAFIWIGECKRSLTLTDNYALLLEGYSISE